MSLLEQTDPVMIHHWLDRLDAGLDGYGRAELVEWLHGLVDRVEAAEGEPPAAHETQETVGAWADATFGPGTGKGRALRLLAEVVELCLAAGATPGEARAAVCECVQGMHLADDHSEPAKVPEELADCRIVLDTLAHTLGVDQGAEVDKKMRTNRARQWRLTGDGCGQHVPEGGAP